MFFVFFFKQKTAYEMRISDGVQTCALPISLGAIPPRCSRSRWPRQWPAPSGRSPWSRRSAACEPGVDGGPPGQDADDPPPAVAGSPTTLPALRRQGLLPQLLRGEGAVPDLQLPAAPRGGSRDRGGIGSAPGGDRVWRDGES